jgi:hypothetical protein
MQKLHWKIEFDKCYLPSNVIETSQAASPRCGDAGLKAVNAATRRTNMWGGVRLEKEFYDRRALYTQSRLAIYFYIVH